MSYSDFALFYDSLQSDVDYSKRTDYLIEIFKKYNRLPTLLLDVACGTGGFTLQFIKRGIDVIGVDPSPEMLNAAREKLESEGINALLLCQTAEDIDLYGTVDGAICCLDSLNHIVNKDEFKRSLKRISLFLEPKSLFIFDLNTEYKHKNILSGNTFVHENDEVFCVWRNSECDSNGVVDISLDFFKNNNDGSYERMYEDFSERAYDSKFIEECITQAGLELVEVFGDMSDSSPQDDEHRVVYVTRKV